MPLAGGRDGLQCVRAALPLQRSDRLGHVVTQVTAGEHPIGIALRDQMMEVGSWVSAVERTETQMKNDVWLGRHGGSGRLLQRSDCSTLVVEEQQRIRVDLNANRIAELERRALTLAGDQRHVGAYAGVN